MLNTYQLCIFEFYSNGPLLVVYQWLFGEELLPWLAMWTISLDHKEMMPWSARFPDVMHVFLTLGSGGIECSLDVQFYWFNVYVSDVRFYKIGNGTWCFHTINQSINQNYNYLKIQKTAISLYGLDKIECIWWKL